MNALGVAAHAAATCAGAARTPAQSVVGSSGAVAPQMGSTMKRVFSFTDGSA